MSTRENEQFNGMFFVDERRPRKSFSLFCDRIKAGSKGLCIARREPDDLSVQELLKKVEYHRLLLKDAENSIRPSDLRRIDGIVSSFFERNKGGTVILEGVEMLLLFNDHSKVTELLNKAKSLADSRDGVIVIPVDSRTIYREDFENVKENFRVLEMDRAENQPE